MQTLATAFNRMTGRLEEQTNALRTANTQLDTRRAFIEAVLSSVTAGVIAVDGALPHPAAQPLGRDACSRRARRRSRARSLGAVSPELDEFMRGAAVRSQRPDRRRRRAAHARGQARALPGRVGADLRRHHRPAVGPAPRRLVGHRAAHRARDQEPADPDPARRRAAAAAVRRGDQRPTRRRSSG